MNSKLSVCFIIVITALLLVTPALAITYGGLDTPNPHSNVGSLVLENPEGELFQWCSGTLIDDDVFLTASHCTADLDYYVEELGALVWVTFDPVIIEGGNFYSGVWHTNPNYNGFQGKYGSSNPGDVAVIVLDDKDIGITPALLPAAGLLDDLEEDHILKDTLFTAVGYGTVRETNRTGPQAILDNIDRNRVDQEFQSLTGSWLTLSMNLTTDNGGTCYGDSGGPHFIHLNGEETDIVASITVTGDTQCKSTDKTYRMDTESALSFLAPFLTQP